MLCKKVNMIEIFVDGKDFVYGNLFLVGFLGVDVIIGSGLNK